MPELTEETRAAAAEAAARQQVPDAEPRQRGRSAPDSPEGMSGTAAIAPAPPGADDVEISGRPGSPPPAHGGDRPPASAVWSPPTGVIAGRDSASRHRPLESPSVPSLGPEGKRRAPAAVVALSVLTLGIYALVWHHRVNVEVANFDTRMYLRAGRSTLALSVGWGIGLLVSAAGGALIVASQMHVTLPYEPPLSIIERYLLLGGLLVVPYLVLALPFCLIAVLMTLERVRVVEDRVGRPTDVQLRPVSAVWWLALPVAGGLVLIAIVQRRLNTVWELVAPAPAARVSEY